MSRDASPTMLDRIARLLRDQAHLSDRERANNIIDEFRRPTAAMIRARGVRPEFADMYFAMINAAQGTEARRAETGTGSVHDGPVAEGDAPQTPSNGDSQ